MLFLWKAQIGPYLILLDINRVVRFFFFESNDSSIFNFFWRNLCSVFVFHFPPALVSLAALATHST